MRGNQRRRPRWHAHTGSIPACAGEPSGGVVSDAQHRVYPRVCGGTLPAQPAPPLSVGLSPRVRGNRGGLSEVVGKVRSIPACAGEPGLSGFALHYVAVYPRVCGGTAWARRPSRIMSGLSPRVRGNPWTERAQRLGDGSIPACAGEPTTVASYLPLGRVYPRVCGGTPPCAARRAVVRGLSPRVRGNLKNHHGPPTPRRSIPACAGEPAIWVGVAISLVVYPRVCGGTRRRRKELEPWIGLSPRVRGNQDAARKRGKRWGSIPACAGEPQAAADIDRAERVYPRVCGGTNDYRRSHERLKGLSPRVRGNPGPAGPGGPTARSIPACAGEPAARSRRRSAAQVYPRVCGGTARRTARRRTKGGLSPRVRGNRTRGSPHARMRRSIPACAGEPWISHPRGCARGVYPRVCGGTGLPEHGGYPSSGLSPRVRGNLHHLQERRAFVRSIPACAGEPGGAESRLGECGVYPRVCGGTRTPTRPLSA